ncbi:MAG: deoxyribodipyrimidine photo-lyase [Rhizobiaceae bacterium]
MPNDSSPIIVLFRNDLRISDNKALVVAASTNPVIPLFVLDETSAKMRPIGAAKRWWLRHSLAALKDSFEKLGTPLILRQGETQKIVAELVETTRAAAVFWNRRYAPSENAADKDLGAWLHQRGVDTENFDGQLLHDPSRVATQSGDFYRVYTPFYKKLAEGEEPRDPIDPPKSLQAFRENLNSDSLESFRLLPKKPDWSGGLAERWHPGETGAHERLAKFLENGLDRYADNRDRPGIAGTSALSPHLAHGEITPFQIMAAVRGRQGRGAETFRKELAWREFSYHLLFHNPALSEKSFRPEFEGFKWLSSPAKLQAWRQGKTGYPIVDAGMRELWQTGWMHNRVRMIAASFLIKDLLIDWREGEKWFWDTLVDADLANNPASWQWVAGSGADAAPYFRIFNPVLQGEKFDAEGSYVRRYVPELAKLPNHFLQRPWEAPEQVLADADIELGKTYPTRIVDHFQSRDRAMRAYQATKDQ